MKKNYKVASLFAGVGGVCLGFMGATSNGAKYDVVWANEVDPNACKTYRANFKHNLIEGDIRKVLNPSIVSKELDECRKQMHDGKEVSAEQIKRLESEAEYYKSMNRLALSEPIDVLNGGFPCQAFSIAGERKGFQDDRGNLFFSIIDLINLLGETHRKPRIVFLENVKNLRTHDHGRTFKIVKKQLESLGYTVKEAVMNTMDFSELPQNRERIYIIAFLEEADANHFYLFDNLELKKQIKSAEMRKKEIDSILDFDLDDIRYRYTAEKYPKYFVKEDTSPNHDSIYPPVNLDAEICETHQFYQLRRGKYVRKNKSNVCPTLTADMGTGGHNVPLIKARHGIRKLTPEEVFKLQGFPIGHGYRLLDSKGNRFVSESSLYKQAGNAVSVPVIELIATHLLEALTKE